MPPYCKKKARWIAGGLDSAPFRVWGSGDGAGWGLAAFGWGVPFGGAPVGVLCGAGARLDPGPLSPGRRLDC
jgi:hypothetical protein